MNRFFVPRENIRQDETAVITGEDVRHIARVLRLRPGDMVTLCDGANVEYDGRIAKIEADAVYLTLGPSRHCAAEAPYALTLLQGLPKGDKLDAVVQKCVELGVYAIQPVLCARSVAQPADFEKKRIRYQRIADEAAKQCGRGMLPAVLPLVSSAALDYAAYDLVLVAYEDERERSLRDVLRAQSAVPARVALLIGPEGGLERSEVDAALQAGGVAVSLGRRILRTETAGMAVLAMLQYEWGDEA